MGKESGLTLTGWGFFILRKDKTTMNPTDFGRVADKRKKHGKHGKK